MEYNLFKIHTELGGQGGDGAGQTATFHTNKEIEGQ
jgi:hypothetical protein